MDDSYSTKDYKRPVRLRVESNLLSLIFHASQKYFSRGTSREKFSTFGQFMVIEGGAQVLETSRNLEIGYWVYDACFFKSPFAQVLKLPTGN